jgi:hypothetical protein
MIVDVHAHYLPKNFSDFMSDRLPRESESVQMLTDGYADLARRCPGRIASHVMLPFPHVDAALNMNVICLNRTPTTPRLF